MTHREIQRLEEEIAEALTTADIKMNQLYHRHLASERMYTQLIKDLMEMVVADMHHSPSTKCRMRRQISDMISMGLLVNPDQMSELERNFLDIIEYFGEKN